MIQSPGAQRPARATEQFGDAWEAAPSRDAAASQTLRKPGCGARESRHILLHEPPASFCFSLCTALQIVNGRVAGCHQQHRWWADDNLGPNAEFARIRDCAGRELMLGLRFNGPRGGRHRAGGGPALLYAPWEAPVVTPPLGDGPGA